MSLALFCDFCLASGRARHVLMFSCDRLPPAPTFSALLLESVIVTKPVAKLTLPVSASPMRTGVLAFGFGLVASRGTPNFPYSNETTPLTSDFIATYQRSKSESGFCRCHIMYHWLLGGAVVLAGEGANRSVNTSLLTPTPKHGSATRSWRTFTRGSGGVFWPESLSVPSALRSSTASTPGTTHAGGVTGFGTNIG